MNADGATTGSSTDDGDLVYIDGLGRRLQAQVQSNGRLQLWFALLSPASGNNNLLLNLTEGQSGDATDALLEPLRALQLEMGAFSSGNASDPSNLIETFTFESADGHTSSQSENGCAAGPLGLCADSASGAIGGIVAASVVVAAAVLGAVFFVKRSRWRKSRMRHGRAADAEEAASAGGSTDAAAERGVTVAVA